MPAYSSSFSGISAKAGAARAPPYTPWPRADAPFDVAERCEAPQECLHEHHGRSDLLSSSQMHSRQCPHMDCDKAGCGSFEQSEGPMQFNVAVSLIGLDMRQLCSLPGTSASPVLSWLWMGCSCCRKHVCSALQVAASAPKKEI